MFSTIVADAAGISAIVGLFGLIATIVGGVFQYAKQNALKRFENYQRLSTNWIEDEDIQKILELLGSNDRLALRKCPTRKKEEFVGYFEEVALMLDSKLLNEHVAYYMFGQYAIQCDDSEEFWAGLEKNERFWALFRRFAARMKKIDADVKAGRENIDTWKFSF